ncbi:MAG: FAD:protein FMN transferase [Deltaproteobacteria bacterium]|nr:FAD:protein FMN transferase [Deltaproteobacteria bacterium]
MKKTSNLKNAVAYLAATGIVFAVLAAAYYFQKKNRESVTHARMLMGTLVEVTLIDGDRNGFDHAAQKAFAEIKRLEAIFSSYMPESDATRVSEAAGKTPVKVSPEFIEALKTALKVSELSDGAFDPTVGALGKLWGYSGEKRLVPSKEEIKKILPLVDYKKAAVDEKNSTVFLKTKGMTINLGGVAKGYIVSKAVEVLKKNGVTEGIIKAGGDMVAFRTSAATKDPFKIGIQHPREKGKLLGVAHVTNGAVSTSGDYERFFMIEGKRLHHILDPKTGFPADKSMSVTIIGPDATEADALSTAIFVMGPEAGMELIEKLDGYEGVIVDAEGRVKTSKGFKGEINY